MIVSEGTELAIWIEEFIFKHRLAIKNFAIHARSTEEEWLCFLETFSPL
jgi:hypothetical protein